jgi:hypothetical protein
VKTEKNIVIFRFKTQLLSLFLFDLRFLPPSYRLILESVKTFFPQEAWNIVQLCSYGSEEGWNTRWTKTRAICHPFPFFSLLVYV